MDINKEYYDRLIRTFGLESINKCNSSSILIIGLEGCLATDICKNLVLFGIKNIYLYDLNIINENDIQKGYYYNEEDLGLIRSQVLSLKFNDINKDCNILHVNSYDMNQDITIIINQSIEFINSLSLNKLIILFSYNLSGVLFVDVGNEYLISDFKGEHIEPIQINNITESGLVICTTYHNLQSSDNIKFDYLEGINLNQLNKEWTINIINNDTFQLLDFNCTDFIFINGTINYVPQSKIIIHERFNNMLDNKSNLINMYIDYFTKNNSISNNKEYIPIVSIMSAFTSFEIIKILINKYLPINQWFEWETQIDINDKILNSEWIITGLGSLGCEHLKNLALLNIKNIHIIDKNNVEESNLSNQFLYKQNDIGKNKSLQASINIQKLNKNLNIKYYNEEIGSNIEDIIKNNNINGIFSGLDNRKDRLFIDEICFKYNLSFFECGVMDNKGHIQPIIPFKTETYATSPDYDINSRSSYLLCVIKSFPNCIDHVIEWSIEEFNNMILFEQSFNNIKDCINFSIKLFNEKYNNDIIKLLDYYKNDNDYWKNGKKCPHPIFFDINNDLHIKFIIDTINIILESLEIFDNILTIDIVKNIYNNNLILSNFNNIQKKNILLDYYNKNHINWIFSSINLRCENYNIKKINLFDFKGKFQKIISTNSIISSLISGLSIIEMIKYLNNYDNYESIFINMNNNTIINSLVNIAPIIKVGNVNINSWTKLEYNISSTLLEFKQYCENIFKTDITMIIFDTTMVYFESNTIDKLNLNIKEIYNKNYITVSLLSNSDIDLPNIIIKY